MERLAIEPTRYLEGVARYLAVRRIEAEPVVVYGDAPQEILAQGRERGCDLFAMSTRGRSGLGRGLLGSVTDAVVRSSDMPVLVVGPRSGSPGRKEGMALKRVVVPLDGSPLAETVLPHVKEMAQKLSLEAALIRVVTVPTWPYAGHDGPPVEVTGLEERLEAEAATYLERVGRGFSDEGIPTQRKVLKGNPGPTILSYAQESSENLVAISTHGRSGLGRLVIGSVADLLIRSLGTPVLVVGPSCPRWLDAIFGGEVSIPQVEGGMRRCEVFGCGQEATGAYPIGPGTTIWLCRECAKREELLAGAGGVSKGELQDTTVLTERCTVS